MRATPVLRFRHAAGPSAPRDQEEPLRPAPAAAIAVSAFLVGVPIVAALIFFPVMFLAGPHGSILPGAVSPLVLIVAWIAVVTLPARTARWVYRRLRARERDPE